MMNTRTFFFTILVTIFSTLLAPLVPAGEAILTEKAKIEALISHLEALQDATFIRNGSEYNSKNAAKFLRGKWDSHEKEIKTAADFISVAATKSSTTGKPYMIRLKGMADTPCATYLSAQLKKIEAAGGKAQ